MPKYCGAWGAATLVGNLTIRKICSVYKRSKGNRSGCSSFSPICSNEPTSRLSRFMLSAKFTLLAIRSVQLPLFLNAFAGFV